MAKIFKHCLQVFAVYEQPLGLLALGCAEGVTIAHIPDLVHPGAALCCSFLGKFKMFQIMGELIQLGDQELGNAGAFVRRQITAGQMADKVIHVGLGDKSVHWIPNPSPP